MRSIPVPSRSDPLRNDAATISRHPEPVQGHAPLLPGHSTPASGHPNPVPGHTSPVPHHANPLQDDAATVSGHSKSPPNRSETGNHDAAEGDCHYPPKREPSSPLFRMMLHLFRCARMFLRSIRRQAMMTLCNILSSFYGAAS